MTENKQIKLKFMKTTTTNKDNPLDTSYDYPNKKDIIKESDELMEDINKLYDTIKKILDRHDKDFNSCFTKFMENVCIDLKQRIKQMEKVQSEKEKLNDINIIKCERDFFRSESVRLNELCQKLKSKIEDMSVRMKLLSNEVSNLTCKWKDSEISNRQLYIDLENSVQQQQVIIKELNETRDMLNKSELEKNDIADMYTSDQIQRDKLCLIIDKLKNDLKKEKIKLQQKENEYNKIYVEDNRLKQIFIDCIEETRKTISKRKTMDIIKKNKNCINDIPLIKYKNFLANDKRKILEDFLFNDEVRNIIRDTIFNKNTQIKKIDENKKNKLIKINLPDIENNDKSTIYNKTAYIYKNDTYKGIPTHLIVNEKNGDSFIKALKAITTNYTTNNTETQWKINKC